MSEQWVDMENNLDERKGLRAYLLGTLEDPSIMTQIETKLFDDDAFAARLSDAEDLLIEEYLDGELSPNEAEKFETHFLAAPERQQHLRINKNLRTIATEEAARAGEPAKAAKENAEPGGWRGIFAIPAFSYALVAVVVLGMGYGVWRIAFSGRGNVDAQLAELAEAYKGTRPFEARISGFGYAAKSDTRGGPPKNPTAEEQQAATRRTAVTGELANKAKDEPGPEAFYGLGKAYLAEGKFEQALALFEQAESKSSGNAKLLSDLGTLYLELGRNAGEKEKATLLDKALRNFERAIQVDPRLLEPRFNRALCLELQNIPEQAKQAWRDYLELDPDSPWADEARTHLARLEEKATSLKSSGPVLQDFFFAFDARDDARAWQIVSQTKEPNTGVMVMQQLARGTVGAGVEPPNDPARYLAAMRYVGELESQHSRDPYFAEMAQHYAAAPTAQRDGLKQAHTAAAEGFAFFQDGKCKPAVEKFTSAKQLFNDAASPWDAGLIELWTAVCTSRSRNIAEVNAELAKLGGTCAARGWKWLGSLVESQFAINRFNQNEISDSLRYNDLAIQTFADIGDTFNLHRVLSTQAYIYRLLQNYDQALELFGRIYTYQNLYYSAQRQAWRNYYVYSEILWGMKSYTSALAAGQEAAKIAGTLNSASIAADSQKLLAILYGGAEKYPQALRTIDSALAEVQKNEPEGERGAQSHILLLQRAHLQRRSGDCGSAVGSYKDVIEVYKQPKLASMTVNLYEAHKGLLQCYMTLGMRREIEAELADTLELAETSREKITEEKNRNTFFDTEQDLYDLAIEHAMSVDDTARAFEYSEQSRARSLLNSMAGSAKENPPRLQTAREVREALPENVQIVQYAVLPSEVIAWVVSRESISAVRTRISNAELREKIQRYRSLLLKDKTGDSEERETAAKELYDLLIKPAALLASDKITCIVPDKDLNYLPVKSLIAPETGRYVLEDYALLSAPSTAVFLLSSETAREKNSRGEETFTAVGNPSFDRTKYPKLEDLPDAVREVSTIQQFYSAPRAFFEKGAEKQAILAAFSRGGIFHFAGHYVVDEISPDRSRMLLADTGGDAAAGGLEVGEIPGQDLSATKLTVLSACSTGVEGYFNGEGMFGAARAFLARGVPLVIASQWNVESAPTADMMIAFHRYRREQKLSSVAALRKAQLDMLHAPDRKYSSPVFWAGFIAIGGNAEY